MNKIFNKIWQMALPYQDKRDDKGHAQITTSYAIRLLELESCYEDIIIPAIILHDIGWSKLSKSQRMLIFNQDSTETQKLEVRYKHQDTGVRLAKKILGQINYPIELIAQITEIISQLDTRLGFISHNEGIVRDADKLWRFSNIGFSADMARGEYSFQELYDSLHNQIKLPDFFYSNEAKNIAYSELDARLQDITLQ
jgi:hypothetical protein